MKPVILDCREEFFPHSTVDIGIFRLRDQNPVPYHQHEFVEIAIIEHGKAIQAYNGMEFETTRGDVFVIPPNHPHIMLQLQELGISNVLFMDNGSIPILADLAQHPGYQAMFGLEPTLRDRDNPYRRLKLDSAQLETVLTVVERLERALHADTFGNSAAITVHFLELITILCDAYMNTPMKAGRILTQLSQAKSYVEQHFREELRVENLAKETGMSLRSFQRHFRQTFRMSPSKYILKCRIDQARKLLLSSDSTVNEIAFQSGFRDATYFSRAFRRQVGTTPNRYRRSS